MYQSNRNFFKRMRNCFYDVHKWLDDVEVEQVVLKILISDLRNAPKPLRKTVFYLSFYLSITLFIIPLFYTTIQKYGVSKCFYYILY